jgi:hypothetical protein
MATTPEGKVKDAIKKHIKLAYPEAVIYMPAASRFGRAGVSDILACINGRFIAIEVKAGTKATALQELFILNVQKAGGLGAVCYGVEDVKKLLEGL